MRQSRKNYAGTFGPTTGDQVRLADTELFIEVERDLITEAGGYGNEVKFGGGKVIRDGMAQSPLALDADSLDLVITNALILDAAHGVIKADIGIKGGRIVGVGHAGNPLLQDGITDDHRGGHGSHRGRGLHRHRRGHRLAHPFHLPAADRARHGQRHHDHARRRHRPAHGTYATTCTPGKWNIHRMLEAAEAFPMNLGFLGKGNCSTHEPLREQVLAGAMGLKLHEDWGTTPAAIDSCLTVADELDVQVAIHTDTLNEAGFLESTLDAFKGRTIHTYHSEGAGGGHAPDIIRVCGEANVLPSSTNPTRPFTTNTIAEHLDMLMVCHHLDSRIPEDVAFAESRIRPETIAAEDMLHDMGAISMMSSDSQAMGRVGEVITRTWQTAHKMKVQFGKLESETHPAADNFRALRYVSKYTICPAITHGIAHEVGSLEVGKLADIVIWKPAFFGVKPETIIKGGFIAWANMGDPNASIPTPQPTIYRPQFGAFGRSIASTSLTFVSAASLASGGLDHLGLSKRLSAVRGCRAVTKRDLLFNDALPNITVDPETYSVVADGRELRCEPLSELPMAQRYFLF